MSGLSGKQFRADDPFEGVAAGSAVAEYDIAVGPVVRSLSELVTDRSIRLLAALIDTSSLEVDLRPEIGVSEEVCGILATVRVPPQRCHEHRHIEHAAHLLSQQADPAALPRRGSETALLSRAWSHLCWARPFAGGGLIDLRQCCGNIYLGADFRMGASE